MSHKKIGTRNNTKRKKPKTDKTATPKCKPNPTKKARKKSEVPTTTKLRPKLKGK